MTHTSFRMLNLYHVSYPNETARMLASARVPRGSVVVEGEFKYNCEYRFRIYRATLFPTIFI